MHCPVFSLLTRSGASDAPKLCKVPGRLNATCWRRNPRRRYRDLALDGVREGTGLMVPYDCPRNALQRWYVLGLGAVCVSLSSSMVIRLRRTSREFRHALHACVLSIGSWVAGSAAGRMNRLTHGMLRGVQRKLCRRKV